MFAENRQPRLIYEVAVRVAQLWLCICLCNILVSNYTRDAHVMPLQASHLDFLSNVLPTDTFLLRQVGWLSLSRPSAASAGSRSFVSFSRCACVRACGLSAPSAFHSYGLGPDASET